MLARRYTLHIFHIHRSDKELHTQTLIHIYIHPPTQKVLCSLWHTETFLCANTVQTYTAYPHKHYITHNASAILHINQSHSNKNLGITLLKKKKSNRRHEMGSPLKENLKGKEKKLIRYFLFSGGVIFWERKMCEMFANAQERRDRW